MDDWAVHQPRAEPMMWSYGCREEKRVLLERCGIRINTIAAGKRIDLFPPTLFGFSTRNSGKQGPDRFPSTMGWIWWGAWKSAELF